MCHNCFERREKLIFFPNGTFPSVLIYFPFGPSLKDDFPFSFHLPLHALERRRNFPPHTFFFLKIGGPPSQKDSIPLAPLPVDNFFPFPPRWPMSGHSGPSLKNKIFAVFLLPDYPGRFCFSGLPLSSFFGRKSIFCIGKRLLSTTSTPCFFPPPHMVIAP